MLRNLCFFTALAFLLCSFFPKNIYADQNQELYDAIVNNDINKVQNLINQHVDLNIVFSNDPRSYSPLQLATENNNHEIFKLLIINGANLSNSSNNNYDFLQVAISNLNVEIVKMLFQNDIQKNNYHSNTDCYIQLFIQISKYNLFNELEEKQQNIYEDNLKKFFEIFQLLIENGRNVNDNLTIFDSSALSYLCSTALRGQFKYDKNHISIAKSLIKAGANVNFKDTQGWTPLLFASTCGDIELSKLLIDNKANIFIKTKNGDNVLKVACDWYKKEMYTDPRMRKYVNADYPALIKYYLDLGLKTDLFRLVHVDNNSVNFYNCENNNYNDEKCINRINFSLENLSQKAIKKVTVLVTIGTPGSGTKVLYRKKHTIDVDLGPDEIIRTNDIYLNNGVNCELTEEGGLYIYSKIEVMSVN